MRSIHKPAICALAALCACSSPRDGIPRIAEIYERAALEEVRNPVIVIHGILGARLAQRSTGKSVWGAFDGNSIDPNSPAGARALALPLEIPKSAHDYDPSHADVHAAGPLEALKLSFLFAVIEVEVYANIIRSLGAGGYTDNVVVDPATPRYADDHYTCFTFFYDWRRDNVENAIEFGRFLKRTRARIDNSARKKVAELRAEGTVAATREARDIEDWLARGYKFDVVAHSMGGLVSRYFLRYGATDLPADGSPPPVTWAGAEEIDRLIIVGTPNFGAIDALDNLVRGSQLAFILPHYHQSLLATMPSIYQLLPRTRHKPLVGSDVDLFDPTLWEEQRWGLLDASSERYLAWLMPEASVEERRDKARAYQRWCLARAKQFHAAVDSPPPAAKPTAARLYLFAADTQATPTRARLVRRGGRLVPTLSGDGLLGHGDATVPRYSAIADEREGRPWHRGLDSPVPWTNVTFISDDHIGLTKNPHFTNNLLFVLLELPPSSDQSPPSGR